MGSEVFPASLYSCIHPDGYEADDFDDVTVQSAAPPSELRIHNGTSWRASFTLKTKTTAERSALRAFRSARKGRWDSFFFTAPDDDVTRLVCFEEFSGRHVERDVWEYRIVLVKVAA